MLALLIALVIGIEVAIPVGTFLLFKGRHDDKTRLWFTSVILSSAAIILTALRPLLPEYASHQIAWLLNIGGFQLMVVSIHRELRSRSYWRLNVLAYLAWIIWVHAIYFMGLNESLGYMSYSLYLALISIVMLWLLWQLNQKHKSLSLRIIQIGFILYMVPAVLRVVAYLNTGHINQLNVFKFSMVTNLLVFTWILAQMFIPFGYWGFTLEKTRVERDEAEAGEDEAIRNADRYRQLLDERDQLLVMSSRFSVVSALSSFSAMLIHDITQPLQTLQLGLERVRANLVKGATRNQIEDDLMHLEGASERASNLVGALRSLMQSGEKQVAPVLIRPLMRQIEGILGSEALQKRVAIDYENLLPESCAVLADHTMLQRIIINLVSNSLNHFAVSPIPEPAVLIRLLPETRHDQPGISIEVQDNGSGFPPALLARVGQPWSSDQPQGLGMALMLSKQLLGIWGGELQLSNRMDGVSGALVRVWLRRAD